MTAIVLRDATVADRARTRVHAVSLVIEPGTVTVLGGRNGAGKSTLLGVIAGELALTQGSVTVLGDDPRSLDAPSLARRRALLDQQAPAPAGFTVTEVVTWGRRCWRGTERAAQDDAVIVRMLDELGITALADRPVHELSGGERRRVHLARVRAQQAPVLLLDEADGELDLEGRYHLDEAMRREATAGTAVIAVSHDLRRLSRCADRMVLLDAGRVVADGTPAEVATADRLAALFGIPPEALA